MAAQAGGSERVKERVVGSRAGRGAISVVLALLLLVLFINNGQPSTLRTEVLDVTGPALRATGLEQTWGVFAPDPRNVSLDFFARVHYEDGTTETWKLPSGGPVLGEYWDYRWVKYIEYLVQQPYAGGVVRPLSQYVAREMTRDGRVVSSVVLVRRLQRIFPPGNDPPRGAVAEEAYFVYHVPRGRRGA
jgi:hypothetical protein